MQRLARWLTRSTGVLLLALLVVGTPAALSRWVGNPINLVRLARVIDLRQPDGTSTRYFLVVVSGALLWLSWLRLAGAAGVGVLCAALRLRPPRLRLLGMSQTLVGGLLGGLVVLGTASPAGSTTPRPAPAAISVRTTGLQVGWSEAGFLAAGVIGLLTLMRRHRLRRLSAGSVVDVPTDGSEQWEQRLRGLAPEPIVDRLGVVWRAASSDAAEENRELLGALTAPDGSVTVLFRADTLSPTPPSSGVLPAPDRWVYPGTWQPEPSAAAASGPAPLVYVGRCGRDALHLTPPMCHRLVVDGPEAERDRIVESLRFAVEVCETLVAPPPGSARRQTSAPTWVLTASESGWVLNPLDLAMAPVGLERHDIAAVRALLVAGAGEAVAPDVLPSAAADNPEPELLLHPSAPANVRDRVEPLPPVLPVWSFMVRLLGPVDVLGSDGRVVAAERSKAVELLCWLVLHRRSATREAARTALWETDVRDTTFANVVSEARRALSRHLVVGSGDHWLGKARGEHLPLHVEVVSDADLVRAHSARATWFRSTDTSLDRVVLELRSALDLVRGAPFIGSGYGWADAEASTSDLTLLAVGIALDLAEVELALGNVDGAFAATSVGLAVLPGHEELVALRLRTHASCRDSAGARHEWQMYLRSLVDDPWQSEPSPWLEELARDLLGDPVTA